MPAAKPKPPANYLAHWRHCLRWLAAQPAGQGEIVLAEDGNARRLETLAAKARGMRRSISEYPGWEASVRDMATAGELCFRIANCQLIAYRKFTTASIVRKASSE